MSSSKRWLQEHFSDYFVKQAKAQGYLSRAIFKLQEIQQKDQLIKSGMTVIDLGASPGSWSQLAMELVGDRGRVIAVDRLPMDPPTGVIFIQGDFSEQSVLDQLLQTVAQETRGNNRVDVVLSDMAPNTSGQKAIDQPRSLNLFELAWDCAKCILKPGGAFLGKVFQGPGLDVVLDDLRQHCKQVKLRKPKASRPRSGEIYVLGKGFVGGPHFE